MKHLDASPKIFFGENALEALKSIPEGPVMLVCDPFLLQSGAAKSITDQLKQNELDYIVFSDIKPDPSIETVAACMKKVFQEKPEVLIALGGGSSMDTTKAALFCCLKYKESLMGRQHIHRPYFIAVPTTSGTGSEVTSYTVITDAQENRKIPLSDRCMIPDMIILNPEYTKTLPQEMTAYTGMDVLTHALEAFASPKANTFTDLYATRAMALTLAYLPKLYSGTEETENHQEMMIASTLAGLAFNNAGLGVCHGLAHTVGGVFHVPHGKANGVILPWVIAFNSGLGRYACADAHCVKAKERYALLPNMQGAKGGSAEELIRLVQRLNRLLGIPDSLKECGIQAAPFYESITALAEQVVADRTTKVNPRAVSTEDAQKLLTDIYEGQDPFG